MIGVTLREYLAGQIMSGLRGAEEQGFSTSEKLAKLAVQDADAVIIALKKPPNETAQ